MNYRSSARAHLRTAKELLSAGGNDNTLFAALKLRMALESVTYDRSKGFAEDLGPDAMQTWQPKKLMERMLEVDPQADADATLSFGIEPGPGETPESMTLLGTDHVLNLRTLKKHYDALGSYLHTPTLAQLKKGKDHDYDRLAQRCEQIVTALETALSSKVWNSTFAIRGEIECTDCGSIIRRRLPKGTAQRVVQCWSCSASYTMSKIENNEVRFEPRQAEIRCPTKGCGVSHFIWEADVKQGSCWHCEACNSELTLAIGVSAAQPKDT